MARQNISSGFAASGVEDWESIFGFSRAVRVGNHVMVTGMAGIDEQGKVAGDIAAQTRRSLERVREALEAAGASLEDVVRTRNFLIDIDDWETVLRIHGEVFGEIRPASILCQVSRFIDPTWLVEIEVDAIIDRDDPRAP
jgi:enamine deaminase RidA (YjgF/YER057c/UK114 family)